MRRVRRGWASGDRCLGPGLDGIGGERAKQKLVLLRKQFRSDRESCRVRMCQLAAQRSAGRASRVFSNVITLDCPPYETLFGNDHVFAQSQVMGDIAGFYRAFGVELSKDIMSDWIHLSVEFEFMHFLAYKESYSRCHDGATRLRSSWTRRKSLVKNHIGRWVPLFADVGQESCVWLYQHVAELMAEWMDFEAAFMGVIPQPYSETITVRRRSIHRKAEYGCGAQDQGNELSLLLNEVGAESFLDKKEQGKDKEEGPVGTA